MYKHFPKLIKYSTLTPPSDLRGAHRKKNTECLPSTQRASKAENFQLTLFHNGLDVISQNERNANSTALWFVITDIENTTARESPYEPPAVARLLPARLVRSPWLNIAEQKKITTVKFSNAERTLGDPGGSRRRVRDNFRRVSLRIYIFGKVLGLGGRPLPRLHFEVGESPACPTMAPRSGSRC